MRRLCVVIAFALVAGSALTSTAAARPKPGPKPTRCVSRPDVAALDQYCSGLPGANGRGANRGPPLRKVLPRALVKRLRRAGTLGRMLLGLPLAAPRGSLARRSPARGLDAEGLLASGRLGASKSPPDNPIRAAVNAVASGSVGVMFSSLLLLSAAGLGGAAWLRFRRRKLI